MKQISSNIILCLFAAILLTSTLPTALYNSLDSDKKIVDSDTSGQPIIKTAEASEYNDQDYYDNGNYDNNYYDNGNYEKGNYDDMYSGNGYYDNGNYDYGKDSKKHQVTVKIERLQNGQYAYKMVKHIAIDKNGPTDLTDRYSVDATIPGPSIEINKGDTLILKSILENNEVKVDSIKPDEVGSIEYSADDFTRELGLFGAIIVHPNSGTYDYPGLEKGLVDGEIQKINPDDIKKQFVLFMVGSTFWGMEIDENHKQTPLWTNPTLGSDLGDLVQFHVLGSGHDHTFHLHAHRWLDPGTSDIIDVKTIHPEDSHDFIVKAGQFVGAGHWQYHCHVFAHMEAGMMGIFNVGAKNSNTQSVAGASPYDQASPSTATQGNFLTFGITDEPGTWFRNVANLDSAAPQLHLGGSFGIINPGGTAHFVMTDTNTVHTVTSLLWPKGAANMPFDQITGYQGGAIVKLEDPGLYVFTCKVHPYMFAGALVDDPQTTNPNGSPAYDVGEQLQLANGVVLNTQPSTTDPTFGIFTSLVKTFFKVTNIHNWKDYTQPTYITELPPVNVTLGGNTIVNLTALNTEEDLTGKLFDPKIPGLGEVWVDTQFEITEGKSKPGTATRINTGTWEIERKVSLPEINMNHPHNMWTDKDQNVIYQTMWFDQRLAVFDRETGEFIDVFNVGDAPSHVITNPLTDLAYVALNGEQGVAELELSDGLLDLLRIIPMQKSGQDPTHPHGHWISADGSKMVTPNALTADSTIYDFASDTIQRTIDSTTGKDTSTGAVPIATAIRPQGDKYYVANLLDSTISVVNLETGELLKNINLLEPSPDGDYAALPIQTPVDPTGKFMVTANTLTANITIVNTDPDSPNTDEVVAHLPCDPGCHGANFGFKDLSQVSPQDRDKVYPYYAYVASKFSNALTVVDPDPNNDGDGSDAKIAGRILLTEDNNPSISSTYESDDDTMALDGTGGQGVLAIPNPYPGWVYNLPEYYTDMLTMEQQDPLHLNG
ncbi:MAG: beta-propeller fold lactonase family protein [Nitrososphaeraceae archaeon]|nr:beta-propeller fold lactonase family protein [Nitrososphaeraceae archaeon]